MKWSKRDRNMKDMNNGELVRSIAGSALEKKKKHKTNNN